MRKEMYWMDRESAKGLLARAPVVHVATTTADGAPLLRTVHGVVVGEYLAFHGAPAGEKTEAMGREAVIGAEEIVASIPSYFVDPERACPATTYYRSAQVHGALEEVTDAREKAEVLSALMRKFQPEGGFSPIAADVPLYAKSIRGLLIVRVSLERLDGKAKLGQNRTPKELARVVERLWERGAPGDARAIELVRAANPSLPPPGFLRGPAGVTMSCALGKEDVGEAIDLLRAEDWFPYAPEKLFGEAHLSSQAWVGARDGHGRLIATARATSDRKVAWLYDVCVAGAWRGRGIGVAVVKLLLDHPAVRSVPRVFLSTHTAEGLYERFGFRDVQKEPLYPWRSALMALVRPVSGASA
jgi:nitroimidazol reductase NimA-like FMN-containing flavoprotein (pyridoxamine 5'-phosphate oxidase superfamily)/GNAT superfamily N-acetyltransferase